MCHPFLCTKWKCMTSIHLVFGIFARSVATYYWLPFYIYVLPFTKFGIMQLPFAIDVDICPRLQQYLSLSSPLIDQKILYFWGPGDNKESFIDVPEWGRERKKWPCFMHVCILSSFVQRYVGSLAMPQSFASYIANAVISLSIVNHVWEKLISISQ